ncbi:uncharacterized protein LOC111378744 isoform X1 [Olea europaea subsp. europaea]|uniref:ADP,ATP carrier protein n=1 Tax=Olea europaea subsp. europaea TaxID=158383 RepID=A0A8S0TPH1_OLEEU|nr:uncharacterized protein LOC111378744 isoform X1 [Olea europaea subsp. europaea]
MLFPCSEVARTEVCISLVILFILWLSSIPGSSFSSFKRFFRVNSTIKEELKIMVNQTIPANSGGLGKHGWFFFSVQDYLGLSVLVLRWDISRGSLFAAGMARFLYGRILTLAGVTIVICCAPIVAFINLISLAVGPSWIAVAISETVRKMVTHVITRSGRELLFTVVTQDEKYKAKICIDVIVQRLGDATAAAIYKLLFSTLKGKASIVSLYALPVCFVSTVTAYHLGCWLTHLQS